MFTFSVLIEPDSVMGGMLFLDVLRANPAVAYAIRFSGVVEISIGSNTEEIGRKILEEVMQDVARDTASASKRRDRNFAAKLRRRKAKFAHAYAM